MTNLVSRSRRLASTYGWGAAHLLTLGYLAIGCYFLSFLIPQIYLEVLRMCYLVFSLTFIALFALRQRTIPIPPMPVVIVLVLQLWSFYTNLYSNQHLGRPIQFGKPGIYILEAMLPYFVASQLVTLEPKLRPVLLRIVVGIIAASCAVAWMQFMRIPPAISLSRYYTYKSIDNWDGSAGLRAVGLTMHPNIMSVEAVIGFVAVASACLWRTLTKKEFWLLLFFSGATITSQGRTGIVALVVLFAIFLALLFKRDRNMALRLTGLVSVLVLIAVMFASNRLGYLLKSDSVTTDSSYSFREARWERQLAPIYPKLAMTGVGPNSMIMGTGPEDKWVPEGEVMENAYRLHLASYGIPGVILYVAMLVTALIGSSRAAIDRRQPIDRRHVAAVGFGIALSMLVMGASSNTVDGYVLPQMSWLVCGLAIPLARGPLIRRNADRPNLKVAI